MTMGGNAGFALGMLLAEQLGWVKAPVPAEQFNELVNKYNALLSLTHSAYVLTLKYLVSFVGRCFEPKL